MPLSYGLVPHLSKKLSKFPLCIRLNKSSCNLTLLPKSVGGFLCKRCFLIILVLYTYTGTLYLYRYFILIPVLYTYTGTLYLYRYVILIPVLYTYTGTLYLYMYFILIQVVKDYYFQIDFKIRKDQSINIIFIIFDAIIDKTEINKLIIKNACCNFRNYYSKIHFLIAFITTTFRPICSTAFFGYIIYFLPSNIISIAEKNDYHFYINFTL